MAAASFDREIARLAGPALVTLRAEPAYLLADTAVVGHLGTDQLGGLAVASSLLLTVLSLSIFLAYGTTASVARLLGAGEHREAAHEAVQGMWLGAAVGVGFALVGAVAGARLVSALGAEGAVATNALVYLRISLVGLPGLLLTLAGTGYLRGLQDTRTPLLVAIGTAGLNLVLEVVLIYGFDQGIGASALATAFAQLVAGTVFVRAVARGARREGAGLAPHLATQRRLVRVGADLVLRTAALRGSLVALTAVATRIGRNDVAAHQIAFEIWNTLAMALDALAIAAQAMIGRLLGAGQADQARWAARRLLRLGLYGSVVTTAVVLALSPVLPRVFTADPAVADLARFLLWWVAGLQGLAAIAFVLDGVLIGAGDQRFLAGSMVVAAVGLGATVAAVVVLDLGIGWVWAALGVLMAIRAVLLLVRVQGSAWLVLGASRAPAR
jgi:putative MATE family efflux protein